MQKRTELLQANRLLVTNPSDHLCPSQPTELTITIELERTYGNRGAAVAPLSMPKLLDILTEHLSPLTEEQAGHNVAPTTAYINAPAAQVSSRLDPNLNHVAQEDQLRFF